MNAALRLNLAQSRFGRWLFRLKRLTVIGGGFFAGYLLLDWISYIYPMAAFGITPWNPQPALVIGLLILAGQGWLPVVFVVILGSEILLRGMPPSLLTAALLSGALTFCYGAMAQTLIRVFPIDPKLEARRDVIRLIGVVTVGALMTGMLYVGGLVATGTGSVALYVPAALRFAVGDSVGILVTLPLILMAADPERRVQLKRILSRKETLAQAAVIGVILWIVFGELTAAEQFKFFYLLFLPLIWTASRSGMIGAAAAMVVVQSGVIIAVQLDRYLTLTVFELQALLIALAITGLFLGVIAEEHQRAVVELRGSLKLAAAGEMAAALAHELNQPLTALVTYAKASRLLAASGSGGTQLIDTLQKLGSEAQRAANVVRRLRDFFRTGSTHLQPASLVRIVHDVIESLRVPAQEKGVRVEFRPPEGIPDLLIDPIQIEVVVRNLIANAFDAVISSPSESKAVAVEITARVTGEVQTIVSDSGPGITAEQAVHLFEPFLSTKATGMGIGLAVSRAIVEAHGGRLWVKPGRGGVVCFTLPRRERTHG